MSEGTWLVVDLGNGERYLGKDVSSEDDREDKVLRLREVVEIGKHTLGGVTKETGPFSIPMLFFARVVPMFDEFARDFELEVNEDFVRWVGVVPEEVVTKLRSDMLTERAKGERSKMRP